MSIWTHVTGNIIIEQISFNNKKFKNISFGNECQFDDKNIETWYNCDIPQGTEGSLYLRYSETYVSKNQKYTNVTITGDLRDFSFKKNKDVIFNWLKNIKLPKSSFIRNGVMSIDFEDEDRHIYIYDNEWIELKICKENQ